MLVHPADAFGLRRKDFWVRSCFGCWAQDVVLLTTAYQQVVWLLGNGNQYRQRLLPWTLAKYFLPVNSRWKEIQRLPDCWLAAGFCLLAAVTSWFPPPLCPFGFVCPSRLLPTAAFQAKSHNQQEHHALHKKRSPAHLLCTQTKSNPMKNSQRLSDKKISKLKLPTQSWKKNALKLLQKQKLKKNLLNEHWLHGILIWPKWP